MKKLLCAVTLLSVITFGIAVSCKKSSPVDCKSVSDKVATAALAYSNDQSSANCKAYKAALQDYIGSSCANSITAEEKAAFQASLNDLTCP